MARVERISMASSVIVSHLNLNIIRLITDHRVIFPFFF